MSHSQFRRIILILTHAWLNLWDKHMTTGRINQITTSHQPRKGVLCKVYSNSNSADFVRISSVRRLGHDPSHVVYYLHQPDTVPWQSFACSADKFLKDAGLSAGWNMLRHLQPRTFIHCSDFVADVPLKVHIQHFSCSRRLVGAFSQGNP